MKRGLKKVAHGSIVSVKKIVSRDPRIKNAIKKALIPHINVHPPQQGYDAWVRENFPDHIETVRIRRHLELMKYRPLISIIIPTYNTDLGFLRDCLDSVIGQIYENWELCIVDDASPNQDVRDLILEYARLDSRIRYEFLEDNMHIAGATNEAVQMAKGEYVALFDHDDLLWPNALYEVVAALNEDKEIDFLYSDEDKITEDRFDHLGPFFKPDYNPDFLHSVNYVTHFSVVRTSLYRDLGGERAEFNGAQDWDLILRIFRTTDKIYHIPKITYSWRIHSESTAMSTDAKPYVIEAQRKAIEDDLINRGRSDALVVRDKNHPGYWKVEYPPVDNPLVSIVIPSKNQYKILKRCIDSIYAKSTYRNFEIILVDTGSTDSRVLKWYETIKRNHENFNVIEWSESPFSYARSCNEGARAAQGDVLIMLNNDTEVVTPEWIERLVGEAQRPEVGAVGCLLLYPGGDIIQHAGVGVGLGGVAANSLQMLELSQPMTQTQHLYANTRRNVTAVTAACLAIRSDLFSEVGGFDEGFRITYNDVDLCLKLHDKGYLNVYTPHARLVHHESISLGTPEDGKKRDTREFEEAMGQFKDRWKKYIKHDPNINPQLSKDNALYDISK